MSKLLLDAALAQEGFSAAPGPETIAVQLEGGKSRHRRVQLGAAAMVAAQWFCTASQYDYLMAFYRARAAHGSLAFTLDLILDRAPVAEYSAHFVPGTLTLSEVRGSVYIVGAQLEVIPLAENAAADLGLVLYREAEVAAALALNMTLMHASLDFGNATIQHNAAGWHSFYSDQGAADSIAASWRPSPPALSIAGLLRTLPGVDGAEVGGGGNIIMYATDNGTIMYTPPDAGYNALATGLQLGDQFTVIVKAGVAYYFRTTYQGTVQFLISHAAMAGPYKFGGGIFSGRITDIKLAVF